MTVYLDASVVVSLFVDDAHTENARRIVSLGSPLILSDLTAAEFNSAMAIHVRTGKATDAGVRAAFLRFDTWCEMAVRRIDVISADIRAAETLIRQLACPLRAADASHLVIARRLGTAMATFDHQMIEAAKLFGVEVVAG